MTEVRGQVVRKLGMQCCGKRDRRGRDCVERQEIRRRQDGGGNSKDDARLRKRSGEKEKIRDKKVKCKDAAWRNEREEVRKEEKGMEGKSRNVPWNRKEERRM